MDANKLRKKKRLNIIKWSIYAVGLIVICATKIEGAPYRLGQVGIWIIILNFLFFKIWQWRKSQRDPFGKKMQS